jgi:hypothetical protein
MVVIWRLESDMTTAEKAWDSWLVLFLVSHTCRCLIHAGVDPTAATVSGDTALHAAAQEGHSQVMAYLLQLGLQVVISFSNVHNVKYWSGKAQSTHRVTMATFWRIFHHDKKNLPSLVRWGVHAHPVHYIYHHAQSCGVRSSWEGRYSPPISTLPLYVLCGIKFQASFEIFRAFLTILFFKKNLRQDWNVLKIRKTIIVPSFWSS